MKYEIINPSDKCYISSENEKVAKFCCLLLGDGRYGLKNAETGETVFSIYLFGISEDEVNNQFGEPLEQFLEHNKKQIADCFNTFEYAGERTSLNNIGERAKLYHNRLMEQDHPTEKGGVEK
jgi:hypothetical protein